LNPTDVPECCQRNGAAALLLDLRILVEVQGTRSRGESCGKASGKYRKGPEPRGGMAVGMALIGGHLVRTGSEAEGLDVWPQEPRCRVCRDPDVRRLVNDLLRWRGIPIILVGGNRRRRVNYGDILAMLGPANEGREERDRITYSSLWIHAKRHYDTAAMVDYWETRFYQELRNAMRGSGRRTCRTSQTKSH